MMFRVLFAGVFTFNFYALTTGAVVFLSQAPLSRKSQSVRRRGRSAGGDQRVKSVICGVAFPESLF
jgi:hypothetical protein